MYFFPFKLVYIRLLSFEGKNLNKYTANSFITKRWRLEMVWVDLVLRDGEEGTYGCSSFGRTNYMFSPAVALGAKQEQELPVFQKDLVLTVPQKYERLPHVESRQQSRQEIR